jgi:hypothetical protein
MITPKKAPKNTENFSCEKCNFICCKKGDYDRHLLTAKHNNAINATKMLHDAISKNITPKSSNFICICGKSYIHCSSYYRHKKTCQLNENNVANKPLSDYDKDELIITLIKQNAELIKGHQDVCIKLSEQSNAITNTNTNNINNSMNTHKTFNLQLFLNETCKDAMDINEFINNMKIDLDDLENTGMAGYVEGISNIVIKNLNKIEQHLRPLHCGDYKREVLYIKHKNEWTKESNDKPILTKAIKTIANENIKQISKWKDKYPDCVKSSSKKNDLYLKIVSNSMNGLTKEEGDTNICKIISNVAKNVVINK